jgi:hypothetical protein
MLRRVRGFVAGITPAMAWAMLTSAHTSDERQAAQ